MMGQLAQIQKLFSIDGKTVFFSDLWNCNNSTLDTNINSYINNEFLDSEILYEEVVNAIVKSKNGKLPGIDCIPNELLKNSSMISVLQTLFNTCFKCGKISSEWGKSIITPIPKSKGSFIISGH